MVADKICSDPPGVLGATASLAACLYNFIAHSSHLAAQFPALFFYIYLVLWVDYWRNQRAAYSTHTLSLSLTLTHRHFMPNVKTKTPGKKEAPHTRTHTHTPSLRSRKERTHTHTHTTHNTARYACLSSYLHIPRQYIALREFKKLRTYAREPQESGKVKRTKKASAAIFSRLAALRFPHLPLEASFRSGERWAKCIR